MARSGNFGQSPDPLEFEGPDQPPLNPRAGGTWCPDKHTRRGCLERRTSRGRLCCMPVSRWITRVFELKGGTLSYYASSDEDLAAVQPGNVRRAWNLQDGTVSVLGGTKSLGFEITVARAGASPHERIRLRAKSEVDRVVWIADLSRVLGKDIGQGQGVASADIGVIDMEGQGWPTSRPEVASLQMRHAQYADDGARAGYASSSEESGHHESERDLDVSCSRVETEDVWLDGQAQSSSSHERFGRARSSNSLDVDNIPAYTTVPSSPSTIPSRDVVLGRDMQDTALHSRLHGGGEGLGGLRMDRPIEASAKGMLVVVNEAAAGFHQRRGSERVGGKALAAPSGIPAFIPDFEVDGGVVASGYSEVAGDDLTMVRHKIEPIGSKGAESIQGVRPRTVLFPLSADVVRDIGGRLDGHGLRGSQGMSSERSAEQAEAGEGAAGRGAGINGDLGGDGSWRNVSQDVGEAREIIQDNRERLRNIQIIGLQEDDADVEQEGRSDSGLQCVPSGAGSGAFVETPHSLTPEQEAVLRQVEDRMGNKMTDPHDDALGLSLHGKITGDAWTFAAGEGRSSRPSSVPGLEGYRDTSFDASGHDSLSLSSDSATSAARKHHGHGDSHQNQKSLAGSSFEVTQSRALWGTNTIQKSSASPMAPEGEVGAEEDQPEPEYDAPDFEGSVGLSNGVTERFGSGVHQRGSNGQDPSNLPLSHVVNYEDMYQELLRSSQLTSSSRQPSATNSRRTPTTQQLLGAPSSSPTANPSPRVRGLPLALQDRDSISHTPSPGLKAAKQQIPSPMPDAMAPATAALPHIVHHANQTSPPSPSASSPPLPPPSTEMKLLSTAQHPPELRGEAFFTSLTSAKAARYDSQELHRSSEHNISQTMPQHMHLEGSQSSALGHLPYQNVGSESRRSRSPFQSQWRDKQKDREKLRSLNYDGTPRIPTSRSPEANLFTPQYSLASSTTLPFNVQVDFLPPKDRFSEAQRSTEGKEKVVSQYRWTKTDSLPSASRAVSHSSAEGFDPMDPPEPGLTHQESGVAWQDVCAQTERKRLRGQEAALGLKGLAGSRSPKSFVPELNALDDFRGVGEVAHDQRRQQGGMFAKAEAVNRHDFGAARGFGMGQGQPPKSVSPHSMSGLPHDKFLPVRSGAKFHSGTPQGLAQQNWDTDERKLGWGAYRSARLFGFHPARGVLHSDAESSTAHRSPHEADDGYEVDGYGLHHL